MSPQGQRSLCLSAGHLMGEAAPAKGGLGTAWQADSPEGGAHAALAV